MIAGEVMSNEIQTIGLEDTMAEAAHKMRQTGSSCLVVTKGSKVAGIITDRDMALGCLIDGHISWQCRVYRHMIIQTDSVSPDTDIEEAHILMIDREIDYLPVVNSGKLVGLLTADDVARVTERYGSYAVAMVS